MPTAMMRRMGPQTPAPDRTSCELRNWVVFVPGFWKGELYSPERVRRIAENYARLKPHLTPVAKIGHDIEQQLQERLKQSAGFLNTGRVEDAGLTPDGCFVIRRLVGIPVDVAGQINAGRLNSGSVELKPSMRDPDNPALVIEGPIFTAIALLGEEQPGVTDKRLRMPRAVFADGTEVPADPHAADWLNAMADVAKTFADKHRSETRYTLCFSDYSETKPVDINAILAAIAALPPDQKAQVAAACQSTPDATTQAAATPAAPPPAQPAGAVNMAGSDEIRGKNQDAQKRAMWAKDPDGGPEYHSADFAAKFAAFADDPNTPESTKALMSAFSAFASDMKKCYADSEEKNNKRFGALEAAATESQKKDDDAKMAAFSAQLDAVYERNDNKRRITPAEWKVKRQLGLELLTSKTFSTDADRTKAFSDWASGIESLPINPAVRPESVIDNPAAATSGGLTDFQRGIVESESFRRSAIGGLVRNRLLKAAS